MGYYNNRDFEVNEEKTADFLTNAVSKITTEEDIDTLLELVKLFKKNVPLSRRKYVIAYMLKESLKHYHFFSKSNNRNGRNNDRSRDNRGYKNDYKSQGRSEKSYSDTEVSSEEEKTRTPRVQIDPDKATSIFIGIGKNRRVYPRDLVGLLIAVAGLERDRIGDIKVLANYSFVQLYTEDAQTAIDKLNEYSYRGRKLAVSYSRQKSDEEAGTESASESFESEDMSAQEMAREDAEALAAAENAAADKEPFGV